MISIRKMCDAHTAATGDRFSDIDVEEMQAIHDAHIAKTCTPFKHLIGSYVTHRSFKGLLEVRSAVLAPSPDGRVLLLGGVTADGQGRCVPATECWKAKPTSETLIPNLTAR